MRGYTYEMSTDVFLAIKLQSRNGMQSSHPTTGIHISHESVGSRTNQNLCSGSNQNPSKRSDVIEPTHLQDTHMSSNARMFKDPFSFGKNEAENACFPPIRGFRRPVPLFLQASQRNATIEVYGLTSSIIISEFILQSQ